MPKRGKKYNAAAAKIDRDKNYSLAEGVTLAKETSTTSFDSTVEVHFNTTLDPRQADQQIRTSVTLPKGLGKTVRVLVFAEGDGAKAALDAGADYIVDDEMIKKIQGGWTDFDAAIATPSQMGKVGRLGRILGPRGLMPSPKSGTVVADDQLPRVINEAKAGRVELRLDRTANIHAAIGKASFSDADLLENLTAIVDTVKRVRPAAAKGAYIKRSTITTTMGPAIRIDIGSTG